MADFKINIETVLNSKTITSQLKGLTSEVQKISKGLLDEVTYQPAQMISRTALTAVQAMVDEVRTLDASVTEFKKVSDLTGVSLDSYVTKLGEIGKETARTTAEMVDAATQFKKAGYNEQDSAVLAETATWKQVEYTVMYI